MQCNQNDPWREFKKVFCIGLPHGLLRSSDPFLKQTLLKLEAFCFQCIKGRLVCIFVIYLSSIYLFIHYFINSFHSFLKFLLCLFNRPNKQYTATMITYQIIIKAALTSYRQHTNWECQICNITTFIGTTVWTVKIDYRVNIK